MSEKQQLLLVDDEPGIRESVQAYLEDNEAWQVNTASNAEEALQTIESQIPDLIISDIMMPEVDGYQFLAQMREDPRFMRLPIVFLTARGMTKDRIEGYNAGVDAYLSKPFDPDELVAIVTNLLTRKEAKDANATTDIADLANQVAEIRAILMNRAPLPAQNTPTIKIDFTPREQSVLDLVAQGLMNKEIARRLETSVRNVEKYVSRLFSKTGTNSRTELVRFALENGLTQ